MTFIVVDLPLSKCGSNSVTPECKYCVWQRSCKVTLQAKTLMVVETIRAKA